MGRLRVDAPSTDVSSVPTIFEALAADIHDRGHGSRQPCQGLAHLDADDGKVVFAVGVERHAASRPGPRPHPKTSPIDPVTA